MSEADYVFGDPGNLKDFESKVGKTLQFAITGSTTDSIWGDGIYTDDSDLDTAAVHAGLVKDGEDATVMVKILPGQGKYRGAARNGVTSQAPTAPSVAATNSSTRTATRSSPAPEAAGPSYELALSSGPRKSYRPVAADCLRPASPPAAGLVWYLQPPCSPRQVA